MLSFHKTLFFAFLLFVFWLPIPLGSNRPWAWSLNEIYVAFLLLGCLFLLPAAQCWLAIQRAKVILIPVALFTLWSWMQSWPSLGLSSDQTLVFISAVKSLHYLQICLVAALLVDTPHKLKTAGDHYDRKWYLSGLLCWRNPAARIANLTVFLPYR